MTPGRTASRASGRVARLIAVVVGAYYVVVGLWAFAAPDNFYSSVAVFAPYNQHFLHDGGAFQVGLGVALILGAIWTEALFAATLAVLVGSLLHFVAHLEDRALGGRPSDFVILGLICVMVGIAAALAPRRVVRT
jgi:uncharacterized membrane protein